MSLPRNAMGKVLKKELMEMKKNASPRCASTPSPTYTLWVNGGRQVLGWPSEVTADGDVLLNAPPDGGLGLLSLGVPEGKVGEEPYPLRLPARRPPGRGGPLLALGARHADIGQGEEPWVVLADPRATSSACSPPTTDVRTSATVRVCTATRRISCVFCGRSSRSQDVVGGGIARRRVCHGGADRARIDHRADSPLRTPLTIGPAATDTYGGWIPDGQTLSPFDVSNPALAQLDPSLLNAIQDAARAATAAGRRPEDQLGLAVKGVPAEAVR